MPQPAVSDQMQPRRLASAGSPPAMASPAGEPQRGGAGTAAGRARAQAKAVLS